LVATPRLTVVPGSVRSWIADLTSAGLAFQDLRHFKVSFWFALRQRSSEEAARPQGHKADLALRFLVTEQVVSGEW